MVFVVLLFLWQYSRQKRMEYLNSEEKKRNEGQKYKTNRNVKTKKITTYYRLSNKLMYVAIYAGFAAVLLS